MLREGLSYGNRWEQGEAGTPRPGGKTPAYQAPAALRYLHFLCADPVLLSLLNATSDDEPYTDQQRAEDAEAAASIARGEGIAHEEIPRGTSPYRS
jgi:hypothetical protein